MNCHSVFPLAGALAVNDNDPTKAIMPVAASIIIGAVFGFVSEIVANALTKKTPAA